MKLITINNINKKDSPIYYRNEYSADSVFMLAGKDPVEVPISFSIELSPTGEKILTVKITGKIDYPLIPVLKILREELNAMERKGLLH